MVMELESMCNRGLGKRDVFQRGVQTLAYSREHHRGGARAPHLVLGISKNILAPSLVGPDARREKVMLVPLRVHGCQSTLVRRDAPERLARMGG